nr:T9SS type A sorting domain-containing protein [Bacteroidota bacterium]
VADSLGNYTIVYTATDSSGNTSVETRNIEVVDRFAPEITLNGVQGVQVCRWADYVDAGITIKDNYKYATFTTDTLGSYENTLMPGLFSLYYKVIDQSGNEATSIQRIILVTESGECATGIAQDGQDMGINIYPNPTNGQFVIAISNGSQERVRISVTDLLGKEVAVVADGTMTTDKFPVDLSHVDSGVYMVVIQQGSSRSVHKVSVVK